ncbi:MAG: hypothetical protein AAB602_02150 [Patescibacteria group bacterium]
MKKSNKTFLVAALLVLLAALLLGWKNIAAIFNGGTASAKTTREIAMSCTLDMYTQFHIHPHLTIKINGTQETIPANVGVTLGCMHPIHTHDGTGEIHVESPEKRDFTLGDFFAVWDKTFTKNQILESVVDNTHEIKMTVNGEQSDEFEKLVLRDKEQIVIEYEVIENGN